MAELVDALASGASVRKNVEVQVLSSVPEIITSFGWFFDEQNSCHKPIYTYLSSPTSETLFNMASKA